MALGKAGAYKFSRLACRFSRLSAQDMVFGWPNWSTSLRAPAADMDI